MPSKVLISVLAASLCLPSVLQAADLNPMEQAQQAWKKGEKLFSQGRYGAAMAEFEKGYRISGKSGFLLNMAECARMTGDKERARELYLRHLTDFPSSKMSPEVESRCRALGVGECAVPATAKQPATPAGASLAPSTTDSGQSEPYLPAGRPARREPPSRPFYKHWGLWVGVGAAVLAGTITAVVLATRSDEGDLPEAEYTVDFR